MSKCYFKINSVFTQSKIKTFLFSKIETSNEKMNNKDETLSCRLCFSSDRELIYIFQPSIISENDIATILEQHFPYQVS